MRTAHTIGCISHGLNDATIGGAVLLANKLFLKKIRILYFLPLLVVYALCSLQLPAASAAMVTLSWDANTEPDLEGYIVYSKQGSPYPPYDYVDSYPEVDLADPLNPSAVITNLESDVTYSFVVTAYDTDGNESDFSNAVSVLNGKLSDTSGDSSGGGGGGGGGCFINTAAYWFGTTENILGLPLSDPK